MNQHQNTACTERQELLVDVLFGDAHPEVIMEFEEHAAGCAPCAYEYESLSATLDAASNRQTGEPSAAFMQGLEARLEKAVSRPSGIESHIARRPPLKLALRRVPAWSLQLAAGVVILAVGVLLGRGLQSTEPSSVASESAQSMDSDLIAVEQRAYSYLDRSRTLLLGVVNFDAATEDPASLGSPRRHRLAQDLLMEASYLQTSLSTSEQQRLKTLVGELEVILLQLANLEERVDLPDIEIVKNGVDRKALLFKIDLEEMRRSVRSSEDSPPNASDAI